MNKYKMALVRLYTSSVSNRENLDIYSFEEKNDDMEIIKDALNKLLEEDQYEQI